jgi:hypothetical protein
MVKRLLTEEDISVNVAVEICKSMEAAQSKVESWSIHQSSGSHESHIRNVSDPDICYWRKRSHVQEAPAKKSYSPITCWGQPTSEEMQKML